MRVSTSTVQDSAAYGAALRALHGYQSYYEESNKYILFENVTRGRNLNLLRAEPNYENHKIYQKLVKHIEMLEDMLRY